MRRRPVRSRPRRSRRVRPDLVLTGAAVLAILLLGGLAHWMEPPLVALGEAQEGARVKVEARVLSVRATERGQLLTLSDGAHSMPAFAPRVPVVARGDEVVATGIVSRVDDGLALSADALRVTRATASVERLPAELAAQPAGFEGARVVVRGEVRDGMVVGGGARVALRGEDAPRDGAVIVTGTFAYRELDASYVVWVESWTRPS